MLQPRCGNKRAISQVYLPTPTLMPACLAFYVTFEDYQIQESNLPAEASYWPSTRNFKILSLTQTLFA